MNKFSSYLINLIAASTGYSEGQLKDNPGDNTGTGIVAQTHNDFAYAIISPIVKYAAVSDTDEKEDDSDMLDALDRMAGLAHASVAAYVPATTYALNDQVFRHGIQFVSMQAANTGNDPISSPTWWFPVPHSKQTWKQFSDGVIMRAGMDPIHTSAGGSYHTWLKLGIHNFGGTSGVNYQAYMVHLDGTVVTGDVDLVAIFDVGGANQYRFIDTVAPDSLGTRTLIDYSATATGEAAEGVPYIIVMIPV